MAALPCPSSATRRLGFVAVEEHVRYLREVHIGDQVSVHIRQVERSAKLVHFISFLVNRTRSEVAATFETVNAHLDLDARRVVAMDPAAVALLDLAIAEHQGLPWEAPTCGYLGIHRPAKPPTDGT